MLSCEFCEISKRLFTEYLRASGSVFAILLEWYLFACILRIGDHTNMALNEVVTYTKVDLNKIFYKN